MYVDIYIYIYKCKCVLYMHTVKNKGFPRPYLKKSISNRHKEYEHCLRTHKDYYSFSSSSG